MCLSKVDKVTKEGNGVGYKVFANDGWGHIYPRCQGHNRYQYHRWYEDDNTNDCIYSPNQFMGRYPSGYHIFPAFEDAKGGCFFRPSIRKVKYEKVVASGTQNRTPVIVARRIYIYPKKEL